MNFASEGRSCTRKQTASRSHRLPTLVVQWRVEEAMEMKRLVLSGLLLTVAVTFTGCGGEHTDHGASQTNQTEHTNHQH